LLSFTVSATDADGDTLTLSAATLPNGASFTDNGDGTGYFSWTPNFNQAGSYTVLFSVTDGLLSDDENVVITVNNVEGFRPEWMLYLKDGDRVVPYNTPFVEDGKPKLTKEHID